jgi:hypothetical protein
MNALAFAVALAPDPERHALGAALARLHLDHSRAHVGHQHGAHGHGDDLA